MFFYCKTAQEDTYSFIAAGRIINSPVIEKLAKPKSMCDTYVRFSMLVSKRIEGCKSCYLNVNVYEDCVQKLLKSTRKGTFVEVHGTVLKEQLINMMTGRGYCTAIGHVVFPIGELCKLVMEHRERRRYDDQMIANVGKVYWAGESQKHDVDF